ncbi:AMP-binding protein [Nesterenkonia sp. MY13]|uniref:AMP-binding protein n=2 Tax=Nesterenkonia sedimenti TaxID=1463632 RepID=A0A7X8YE72_9MICC|nr:AMP-binding protein [Nesterenkonia sedimenti]
MMDPASDAPPLEFLPAEAGQPPKWLDRPEISAVPEGLAHGDEKVAVVVRTSGSTGTPKQTLLSAGALRASARMTAETLGGHGQWLLTLQPSYVAGLAILTRSLEAETTPVALLENTTDAEAFTRATEQLTGSRRYVSLVPTQLRRLLEQAQHSPELLAALRSFDAILLGGAPTPAELFDTAQESGLNVTRTYGMAETCGGCVYDGYPLPGVTVELGTHGRVLLSGPMVALGYYDDADLTAEKFETDPLTGQRRFRTDDLGQLSRPEEDGQRLPRLSVTGRADDVINTGGIKVSAEEVRRALESHPSIREAFVAGIPDNEWGQKVVAAVVLATASRSGNTLPELEDLVRERLGAPAVPKHFELLGALPLLPNGKPDRQTLLRQLSTAGRSSA